jgi:hypothetical protein
MIASFSSAPALTNASASMVTKIDAKRASGGGPFYSVVIVFLIGVVATPMMGRARGGCHASSRHATAGAA